VTSRALGAGLQVLAFTAIVLAAIAPSAARGQNRCAAADGLQVAGLGDDGLAGTGLHDRNDGLGGTGHSDPDSGLGGTGLGVFGTITAFGSICVNGLRVGYQEGIPVELNGREGSTADLDVGQVVWIEAGWEQKTLQAHRIAVHSATVGRIVEVDAQARRLQIGDRWIEVPSRIPLVDGDDGESLDLDELATGSFVEAYGLVDANGELAVSRLVVGATRSEQEVELPAVGDLVRASSGIERLSIEGFVAELEVPGRLRIDGLEVELPREAPPLTHNARVWIHGQRIGEGRLRADRIVLRPQRAGRPDSSPTAPTQPISGADQESEEGPATGDTGGGDGSAPGLAERSAEVGAPEAPAQPVAPLTDKPTQVAPERAAEIPSLERPARVAPEIERPERPDRVELPERPEPVLRIERPEARRRPERLDRPQKPGVPVRVERAPLLH